MGSVWAVGLENLQECPGGGDSVAAVASGVREWLQEVL